MRQQAWDSVTVCVAVNLCFLRWNLEHTACGYCHSPRASWLVCGHCPPCTSVIFLGSPFELWERWMVRVSGSQPVHRICRNTSPTPPQKLSNFRGPGWDHPSEFYWHGLWLVPTQSNLRLTFWSHQNKWSGNSLPEQSLQGRRAFGELPGHLPLLAPSGQVSLSWAALPCPHPLWPPLDTAGNTQVWRWARIPLPCPCLRSHLWWHFALGFLLPVI